jgi:hypothetical protein
MVLEKDLSHFEKSLASQQRIATRLMLHADSDYLIEAPHV